MEIRPIGTGPLDGCPALQAGLVVSDAAQASGLAPRSASATTKFQRCPGSPSASSLVTFSAYRGINNA